MKPKLLLSIACLLLAPALGAATFAVTNTNNSGTGSLRQALIDAAAAGGPDIITFDGALSGGTITLLSQIAISDASTVTVDASALPAGITLSGGGSVRHFVINAGSTANLTRLTLTSGSASAGGAISNNGTLTLTQCTLTSNSRTYALNKTPVLK